jgi:hypothetical protein
MKTIAKEMPLDLFVEKMNTLNQPFFVWAFVKAMPGADFDCSINATKIDLWTLPGNDLKQATLTFKDGTGNKIEFNGGCDTVVWDDNDTMQCYCMDTAHATVTIYTPDGKPFETEVKE